MDLHAELFDWTMAINKQAITIQAELFDWTLMANLKFGNNHEHTDSEIWAVLPMPAWFHRKAITIWAITIWVTTIQAITIWTMTI